MAVIVAAVSLHGGELSWWSFCGGQLTRGQLSAFDTSVNVMTLTSVDVMTLFFLFIDFLMKNRTPAYVHTLFLHFPVFF